MPFTVDKKGWLSLDAAAAPFISTSDDSLLATFVFFCVNENDKTFFRRINGGKRHG